VSTVHQHDTARNLAVTLTVEMLIPCILHMKMRLGEKIFQVIVNSGLERYEKGLLDGQIRTQFVTDLELVMKTHVLVMHRWVERCSSPLNGLLVTVGWLSML
jgi:hypothetical protein